MHLTISAVLVITKFDSNKRQFVIIDVIDGYFPIRREYDHYKDLVDAVKKANPNSIILV